MDDTNARRQEKIDEILETAMKMVSEGGMDALTVQKLANQVGAAVGALYRYFPSKDALLAELQIRNLQMVSDMLDESLVIDGPDDEVFVISNLVRTALGYARFAEERPHEFRLIALAVSDPLAVLSDDEAIRVTGAVGEILDRVVVLIDHATELGAMREGDARVRAMSFWLSIQGVLSAAKLARLDNIGGYRVVFIETIRDLLGGWGVDRDLVDDAFGELDHYGSLAALDQSKDGPPR